MSKKPPPRQGSSTIRGDAAPLMFIVRDASNFKDGRKDAKAVASHVSSRYRGWRKTNREQLNLDSTTKAILGAKRRKLDGPSFISSAVSRDVSVAPTEILSEPTSSVPSPIFTPADQSSSSEGSLSTALPDVIQEETTVVDVNDDYKQYTSRLSLLSPTAENSGIAAGYAWRLFEDFVTPQPVLVGCHSLDPFSSFGGEMDLEMRSNLHFYFTVVQPFAMHLITGSWSWFDSIAYTQSSKVLAYAVASFASLFLSGCLRGGPGVVLPPPTDHEQSLLWPIPPFLRLQTVCLSELSELLRTTGEVDEACFQAVLFLFRISVLLADGAAARLHAKALKKIGSALGKHKLNLNTELAVAKVNIISAFLHDSSTVVVDHRPDATSKQLSYVVELDQAHWTHDIVWQAHRGMMAGRVLCWREVQPHEAIMDRSEPAILRMDPKTHLLAPEDMNCLIQAYQIALFFDIQLHGISCNTDAPRIRANMEKLKKILERLFSLSSVHDAVASAVPSSLEVSTARGVQVLAWLAPVTLFNVLRAGAVAARGHVERTWFVVHIATLYPQVLFMDDVLNYIARFVDIYTLVTALLEELWREVLECRDFLAAGSSDTVNMEDLHLEVVEHNKLRGDSARTRYILWRKDLPYIRRRDRPITRSPNLNKPRLHVDEDHCGERAEVAPEFE
jgi:hypothetical protein